MNVRNKLTSYNFARNSDFVYSETVTPDQFNELRIDKKYIVEKNDYRITYKLDYLEIYENSIVFCNSHYLNDLFYLMNKIRNLKNIKLITHQTDLLINESIFLKKPSIVSEWYSINVGFEHKNLIPIPIGLANDYSPKNIKESKIDTSVFEDKELKLYINFNPNTNSKHRNGLYEIYKEFDWVVAKNFNLEIETYNHDIKTYSFVLSPWGNGIDTHRLWETIYSGSIPVTNYHQTYKSAENLPIFFVNDLRKITEEDLKTFLDNIKYNKYEFEKLNVEYWIDLIRETNLDSKKYAYKKFSSFIFYYFKILHSTKDFTKSKFKIFKYFIQYPLRLIKK